jgi:hypothetical protein
VENIHSGTAEDMLENVVEEDIVTRWYCGRGIVGGGCVCKVWKYLWVEWGWDGL